MDNSVFEIIENDHYCLCQIVCIGWCAYLVEHHLQLWLGSSQAQHSLHEVLTELRVQPCRTDDHMLTTSADDCLLTMQFSLTVHPGRRSLLLFCAWCIVRFCPKNIVGRYMHQQAINLTHCYS